MTSAAGETRLSDIFFYFSSVVLRHFFLLLCRSLSRSLSFTLFTLRPSFPSLLSPPSILIVVCARRRQHSFIPLSCTHLFSSHSLLSSYIQLQPQQRGTHRHTMSTDAKTRKPASTSSLTFNGIPSTLFLHSLILFFPLFLPHHCWPVLPLPTFHLLGFKSLFQTFSFINSLFNIQHIPAHEKTQRYQTTFSS